MQNIKPKNSYCFLKYILIITLSILFYGCNINFIKSTADITDKRVEKPKISETQINIDQLLIEKEEIEITNLTPLKKIALMLPVTGKYSKIGKAIYAGIELELKNYTEEYRPELIIYDTGDQINIKKIYKEILFENFDFVIGPLQKEFINKIINYGSESLPILTLNYSDNLKRHSNYVYQFGLLPEDEAICIAEKVIIDGNDNAAILYPDNSWGVRIAESFIFRFEELGGNIINKASYQEGDKKINNIIRNLLKIEDSIKRKKKIEDLLNTKLQYKPHIINDLNTIFSVGTSSDMRSIKPQFNFNFAEDIPFYSTSHIYNGVNDKELNDDLNNIKFCDIPWLYNQNHIDEKISFMENIEKKYLLRFIALGMDSIKILSNIDSLILNKNKYLPGDTGHLKVDEFNRIRRDPIVVQFKNGKARKIPF
ncbi:MAG: penicillin-binding protein activator [Gammaproteobacteria bacterium]|jgi:uncharacterized protein|nr:penicillin-binding protein activator [Gammaproteobacteria bacterium]MBT7603043.1 penicillin-binding protein activator [Gammaproteobacteria bacterium]